jgi:bacterial/archaeal transporter family-2 protein
VSGAGIAPARPAQAAGQPTTAVALATGLASGALAAAQARINGTLGERLGSSVVAALVSFSVGLVLVAALVAALGRTRRAVRPAIAARLPWWTYLGGLGGATVVVTAAAAVPVIGVATFTVGFVAGQALGGLIVDRTRLGAGEPRPLSGWRVAGAVLAVVAVAVVRLGHGGGGADSAMAPWLLLASAVGGGLSALQQALNGRVQGVTGEPLLATLINFAVGTAGLAVLTGVVVAAGAVPTGSTPAEPLLYAGGALGVCVIVTAVWTVGRLGVLRLGLVVVAGQLAGGLVIDLVSPSRTGGVDLATVAGVVLTAVAVALAGRAGRIAGSTGAAPAAGPTAARDRAAAPVDPASR